MDIIKELGELAFGSRLRRLVKRTDRDISRIYKQLSLDFHPHWFPLLIVLHKKKRASITYIANAILYSHTAVYKIATEMTNHGLLASNADLHDGRKRSLSLTKKGHDTVSSMIPIWEEIRFVTKELVGSSSHNILTAIGAIEEELDKKSVYNRIRECMESRMMDQIEIVDYMSRYKHHFSKLNRQWLQRYFSIEEHDELILERPYYEIIKKGGCILFARLNRRIVGTAALLKHGDGVFELAKMAVAENVRRRFVGTKLTAAIIERCIVRGADSLYLETNSQLKPAQQLYRKMGFKNVDKSPISQRFKRGRIMMKLDLNQQKPS